jgi:hypothetical protein
VQKTALLLVHLYFLQKYYTTQIIVICDICAVVADERWAAKPT